MLTAEIQQFLGFLDAADDGAGHRAPSHDQRNGVDHGFQVAQKADEDQRAIQLERGDVGLDVVGVRHRVDDQVELVARPFHLLCIGGDDDVVRAQAAGIVALAGRAREQGDFGSQGLGQLDGHVAQTTQAHHGDLAALAHVPVTQWRPRGDAGAQDGRHALRVEVFGYAQHEGIAHGDAVGVAAVGGHAVVAVLAVVGEGGAVLAVLLQVMVAGFALSARIHHAAHTDQIARLEAGDILADAAHAADDLVARHDGVGGAAPVVAGGVQVAVADTGVEDVDDDIVRPGIASLEAEGDQGLVGCVGGIAVDVLGHGRSLLGVGYSRSHVCGPDTQNMVPPSLGSTGE